MHGEKRKKEEDWNSQRSFEFIESEEDVFDHFPLIKVIPRQRSSNLFVFLLDMRDFHTINKWRILERSFEGKAKEEEMHF